MSALPPKADIRCLGSRYPKAAVLRPPTPLPLFDKMAHGSYIRIAAENWAHAGIDFPRIRLHSMVAFLLTQ